MTYAQYGRLHVHVSASAREVIRKARKLLSASARTREMRTMRQAWVRKILKHHEDERELFRYWRF